MKRGNVIIKLGSLLLTMLLIFGSVMTPGSAFAYTVTSQSHSLEPIGEGVTIETYTQYTNEGVLKIYVTKVDLTNPYVVVDTLLGNEGKLTGATSVTKMVTDNGAIAGINGDFFQMNEKAPIGLTVKNGEIVSSPAQRTDMYGFGLTTEKMPSIKIFDFEGKVTAANGQTFPLFGVNKPTYLAANGISSDKDKLNLYTPLWGTKSRGKLAQFNETVEVVVENDQVKEIRTNLPGVTIPHNGYILSANGQAANWVKKNFAVGNVITVNYEILPDGDKLQSAVGGQAMLVNYGERSWFSQNIKGKLARTAIGYTQDRKTLYMVVVEGGTNSRGMTQEELADFMVSLGCWQALNLDGGGSSTMSARLLGEESISLLNRPKQGSQRAVPTGIGIFSTAPAGDFAGLRVRGERFVLVGTSSTYSAKGYDEHYNPYKVDPNEINWTIDDGFGSFEGSTLRTHKSGKAQVIASYNGVSQPYDINILGASDIAKIEIKPANLELNVGDSVNLSLVVTAKNGIKFDVKASEIHWEVTDSVGEIQGDTFKAASVPGVGQLTAVIDGLQAIVPVSIGAVEKPYSGLEAFKGYAFSGYPAGVTGVFRAVTDNEPVFRGTGAAKLEYDLTKAGTTGAAYGRFGDGLTLPGRPLGIGLWVYGNGKDNHWLRAKIVDANGNEKLVDLEQSVNWQGWRKVSGKFPADLAYPVKLSSIYVVETDPAKLNKGSVIFDELTLMMPVTANDLKTGTPEPKVNEVIIQPHQATRGTLGEYLLVTVPAGGLVDERIRLAEEWVLDKATPGHQPILPAFYISGQNANADTVVELTEPATISFKYTGSTDVSKIRLKRWNPASQGWVTVPSRADATSKTITAKTKHLGLFAVMEDVKPITVFEDIGNSWAKNQINQMAAMRVVSGFPGNKFMPDKGVTRAEFVVLLANLFGWEAETPGIQFKDSIPAWAKKAIAAGVERGIVKGYADGTFQPGKKITRAEMAVIIDNCLQLPNSNVPSNYDDAGKIPSWAVQAIRDTKVANLLKGNNNKFRPQDTASRAEATTVLYNVLNYYIPAE